MVTPLESNQMSKMTNTTTILVGLAGGEISAVTEHGEITWSLGLVGGKYLVSDYLPLLGFGETLNSSGAVTFVTPTSRLQVDNFGALSVETGANPDFVVTSATRMQREMELTLDRLNQTSAKAERAAARYEALAAVVPVTQAASPVDVLDDGDVPPIEIIEDTNDVKK